MTQPSFDPCRQWLGIDAVDLADPRRALGLAPNEIDPQAIIRAATIKFSLLQSVQPGPFAMAHAALLRRITECRDTLLAEAAAAAAPQFSMPPPPGNLRPPPTPVHPAFARPMPPSVPLPPPVPQAVQAGFEEPPIAAKTRSVRRHRQTSSGLGLLLLLTAGLAAAAGVMGYQAMQQQKPKPKERPVANRLEKEPSAVQVVVPRSPKRPRGVPDEETPPDPSSDRAVSTSKPPAFKAWQPSTPPAEPAAETEPPPAAASATPPPADEREGSPTEPPPPALANADMVESEADASKITGLLGAAYAALQDQQYDTATNALKSANAIAVSRAAKKRITQFEDLVHYSREFYGYRDKALADVRPGIEYEIQERKIAVVEIDEDRFVYREAGKNKEYPRDRIPAALLTHIVSKWFDARPENNLFLGAYFATKTEPNLARAREYWETAQAGGADAAGLLPLLDDPILLKAVEE